MFSTNKEKCYFGNHLKCIGGSASFGRCGCPCHKLDKQKFFGNPPPTNESLAAYAKARGWEEAKPTREQKPKFVRDWWCNDHKCRASWDTHLFCDTDNLKLIKVED